MTGDKTSMRFKLFRKWGAVALSAALIFGTTAQIGITPTHAAAVTSFAYTSASDWKSVVTGLSASAATSSFNTGRLAVSMDGSRVAYNDTKSVYLYDNTTGLSKEIYTTDTAVNPTDAVISDDGLSVAFYRGSDLIVWKEATGAQIVFTSTTGTLRGQLTMSSDASVIGFATVLSGSALQYAIYQESTGETKQFTANSVTGGTKNNVTYNLGSSPVVISPDGLTAYLSYYFDTYSNANYVGYYNIASGGNVSPAQYDSAENVHPHGITRDGKYLYGMAYYLSTNNFQIRDVGNYAASKKSLATGTAATQIAGYTSTGSLLNGTTFTVSDGVNSTAVGTVIGATQKKGFSGDGRVVYGISGGNLYRIDLSEIIDHLPDVGLPAAPTVTLGTVDRNGVSISFKSASSMASTTFRVMRDGVQIYSGTGSSYRDTTGEIAKDYTYTVQVRGLNGEFSASSEPIVTGKPAGVATKLGSATVKAGDYVSFGPYKWRLIGDDRLMSAESYITRVYDVTTSLDQLFGVKSESNIGYYLNDTVLGLFSEEDQAAIKMTTWVVTANNSSVPLKSTRAKIGLLTAAEHGNLNLPYNPPSGWTLTPSTNSTTPGSFYTNSSGSTSITNSQPFYPVVNLIAGMNILSGAGTLDNPYVIGGGALTSLDTPVGVKLKSVTTDEIELTWSSVVNAKSYDVLQDGKVIGTVSVPAFKGSAGEAGKEHEYTIVAKMDKLASSPSEALKVTTPEKTVEEPTNPTNPTNPTTPDVVATPKNFAVVGLTTTNAVLGWTTEENTTYKLVADGVTLYEGAGSGYTDATLSPSQSRTYMLYAVKGGKESEGVSLVVTAKAEYVPYPMGLTVTDVTYSGVTLAWDAVAGADMYTVTANGQEVETTSGTTFTDLSVEQGKMVVYGVKAHKGASVSKESKKSVFVPFESVTAPDAPAYIKATRVGYDQVALEMPYVQTAQKYQIFRDTNVLVYEGPLTSFVDHGVASQSAYTYHGVAVNTNGSASTEPINVTTTAEPVQITVSPAEPKESTITFKFKTVEGASDVEVYYNPNTHYSSNGDGTWNVTRFNTQTQETENLGVVQEDSQGNLPYEESGIQAGKDYEYNIVAYKKNAAGQEEIIGQQETTVTAPADGSGATVPGTTTPVDPGTGGGTTPTTPVDPGTGGNTGGGTTPTPTPGTGGNTGGGGSTPTTPGDASGGSTGGGSTGGGSAGGGSGSGSTPVTPGTGGGSTPTTPGTVVPTPGVDDPSTDSGSGTDPVQTEPKTPTFTDVLPSSYAYEAIESLYERGIVKGAMAGSFDPSGKVTRAQFAIMLKRAMGYTSDAPYAGTFRDYDATAWYAVELAEALNTGVTKGYTDGTYRPNAYVPREQVAVMVSNVLRMNNMDTLTADFGYKDAYKVVAWALSDVKLVNAHKIISGYTDNTIRPQNDMTRAEAAVIIYRLLSVLEQE